MAEFHLIDEIRQKRIDDVQPLVEGIRGETEEGFNQEWNGARRPSLRVAGDRIADRLAVFLPAEAGKQLRKAIVLEFHCGFEQADENSARFFIVSVTTKACRNQ